MDERARATAAAIKLGLRNGFRVLYHCEYVDDEGLDLMEARRETVFIGPSIAAPVHALETAASPDAIRDAERLLQLHRDGVREMLRRGVRVVPGSDYGFANLPHGTNARDLSHFVEYLGLSPAQALVCATRWGGELMAIPELGQVREGWLADLILVEGDPLQDIGLLAHADNLRMIMKGGWLHKRPEVTLHD